MYETDILLLLQENNVQTDVLFATLAPYVAGHDLNELHNIVRELQAPAVQLMLRGPQRIRLHS